MPPANKSKPEKPKLPIENEVINWTFDNENQDFDLDIETPEFSAVFEEVIDLRIHTTLAGEVKVTYLWQFPDYSIEGDSTSLEAAKLEALKALAKACTEIAKTINSNIKQE